MEKKFLKTPLPEAIENLEQAKAYLKALYDNGESYHPDDNAADCLSFISKKEGEIMDALMDRICALAKGTDFDPCLFLLELDPNYRME